MAQGRMSRHKNEKARCIQGSAHREGRLVGVLSCELQEDKPASCILVGDRGEQLKTPHQSCCLWVHAVPMTTAGPEGSQGR